MNLMLNQYWHELVRKQTDRETNSAMLPVGSMVGVCVIFTTISLFPTLVDLTLTILYCENIPEEKANAENDDQDEQKSLVVPTILEDIEKNDPTDSFNDSSMEDVIGNQ